MRAHGIIFAACLMILQVNTESKNNDNSEDTVLREVFEVLKRQYYSHTTTKSPRQPSDTHMPGEEIPTVAPPPITSTVEKHNLVMDNNRGAMKPLKNEFFKLNTLPGCDFLINAVREAQANPIDNDIIDYFNQDNEEYAEALATDLKMVLMYSQDYEAVALLATRKVTKLILKDRLRCPATKFDLFTVQQMFKELEMLIHDEDNSMYDFLASTLLELPDMTYGGYEPNYLAHQMTSHIHAQLFNDTIDYLLGTSLQDVEDFAKLLYDTLTKELPELDEIGVTKMTADLREMVHDNIFLAGIKCPSPNEVNLRHLNAIWDMTNGLKEIETYEVCMHVRNYLEQFLIIPSHASFSDVHDYDTVMKDICSYVRGYVKAILEQEEDYHKMVAARDPLALQEFFQHYLTKGELTVLAEVLEKMHWTPNFPVTDKVPTHTNVSGLFLPMTHVITNELQDISFWNSFLDTLDKEMFEQMSLIDFKESIRRWLKDKNHRLAKYYDYHNITSDTNE